MESLMVNGNVYELAVDYKDNDELRAEFNRLTRDTYGFDFEGWYELGYWGERYIPYSLLDGGKVVSNVSVNVIEFVIDGAKRTGVQIGTVMTDKGYRKLGLNRAIMEFVLDEWKDKVDFIYLFANDGVTQFYPKFGFRMVDEYQCFQVVSGLTSAGDMSGVSVSSGDKGMAGFCKLNMDDAGDRDLLVKTIEGSVPMAKLWMGDNASLIMFYCTSFMKNDVYYIDEYDCAVIGEYDGDTLYVNGVYSVKEIDLDRVLDIMVTDEVKRVVFGFTPIGGDYEVKLLDEEDTTLFVYGEQEVFLDWERVMFPVLSHA